jgi:hypothetical protein
VDENQTRMVAVGVVVVGVLIVGIFLKVVVGGSEEPTDQTATADVAKTQNTEAQSALTSALCGPESDDRAVDGALDPVDRRFARARERRLHRSRGADGGRAQHEEHLGNVVLHRSGPERNGLRKRRRRRSDLGRVVFRGLGNDGLGVRTGHLLRALSTAGSWPSMAS